MFLSNVDIRKAIKCGDIEIDPFDERQLQPASYDVRLGNTILDPVSKREDRIGKGYFLYNNQFRLGSVFERVRISDKLVARIEGKSSIGRTGLTIHVTAGFVDPGWDGNLTLEMINLSQLPFSLEEGMLIAQISFAELSTPSDGMYGDFQFNSKYQNATRPEMSKS